MTIYLHSSPSTLAPKTYCVLLIIQGVEATFCIYYEHFFSPLSNFQAARIQEAQRKSHLSHTHEEFSLCVLQRKQRWAALFFLGVRFRQNATFFVASASARSQRFQICQCAKRYSAIAEASARRYPPPCYVYIKRIIGRAPPPPFSSVARGRSGGEGGGGAANGPCPFFYLLTATQVINRLPRTIFFILQLRLQY